MKPDYPLMLAALLVSACGKAVAGEAPPSFTVGENSVRIHEASTAPVRIATEEATLGPPVSPPSVSGRVTTVKTLTTHSLAPLSGRVSELRVRVGDRVAKGDRLLRVQTSELATLQRDLHAAKLAEKSKQALLERLKRLSEHRGVSESDVLVAESELAEAKLQVEASSAVLRSLAVMPADSTSYWVVAPRAGTVVALNATPGAEIGPQNDQPTAVVADLSEVLVIANFSPQDAALARRGDPIRVTVPGGGIAKDATIDSISEVVDPETQTVPVRVLVANESHALRPNGFVEVSLGTPDARQVLSVSSVAVVSDGARSAVFVETAPGLLEKRVVQLGRQGRERTEILDGLRAGERVVSSGALLLLNAIDLRG